MKKTGDYLHRHFNFGRHLRLLGTGSHDHFGGCDSEAKADSQDPSRRCRGPPHLRRSLGRLLRCPDQLCGLAVVLEDGNGQPDGSGWPRPQ